MGEPAAAEPATARYPVDPDIAKLTKHPYRTLEDSRGTVLGSLKTGAALPALFGDIDDPPSQGDQDGTTINKYLWRGALDTIAFMPVEVADLQGGVIQTGWYKDQERPNERFKVNVFVISEDLKSEGIQVGVFRERRESGKASWRHAGPHPEAAEGLKAIIVDRAEALAR
ncbi:MAG: DUF3576 domain-containing protein [Geminicoccaceae bacterium]